MYKSRNYLNKQSMFMSTFDVIVQKTTIKWLIKNSYRQSHASIMIILLIVKKDSYILIIKH